MVTHIPALAPCACHRPLASAHGHTHPCMHHACAGMRAGTHASKHSSCACAYNRMHIGASMTTHPYACARIQELTHAHNGPDACQHVAHACTFARLPTCTDTRIHAYTHAIVRIQPHACTCFIDHARMHVHYACALAMCASECALAMYASACAHIRERECNHAPCACTRTHGYAWLRIYPRWHHAHATVH